MFFADPYYHDDGHEPLMNEPHGYLTNDDVIWDNIICSINNNKRKKYTNVSEFVFPIWLTDWFEIYKANGYQTEYWKDDYGIDVHRIDCRYSCIDFRFPETQLQESCR